MSFIERERAAAHDAVIGWANTAAAAWASACRHDGIDPEAALAVFSDDNPFAPYYYRAYATYVETMHSATVFGYAGMTTESGKAALATFRKPRRPRTAKQASEPAEEAPCTS